MVAEPTRIEAQEVENASEGVHVECRFFEIVPSEKGASLFGRVKPSPQSLGVGLSSKCQLSAARNSLPSS